jgi:kynurenine formamidase
MTATDGLPTYAELLARTDAPAGSIWGVFGDGDEIGALNLLPPERVQRAAAAVQRGAVFSLDYPLNAFPTPSRPPATHDVIELSNDWRDDSLDGFFLQQTTQIDGLRHVRHTAHGFYGGTDPARVAAGDPVIGIGRWADRGIVGRGVLVDLAGRLDHDASDTITPAMLDDVLAAQGTALEPGDLLLLNTGYAEDLLAHMGDETLPAAHPHAGLEQSHEMLAWLWDHRIPLVASDTFATERIPIVPDSPLGEGDALGGGLMHPHLIALLGMVIGELWKLEELAADCRADGRYECLLVVKPLNLVGGVGSPANATALK